MLSFTLQALTALLLLAQPDPPLANRPDGFSNIVGKYDVQVRAAPTEVQVEEPITLHIRIVGAGPALYEPDRKYLQPLFLETWNDDFYVQELPDEHRVLRDQKTWLFSYRLKPRNAKVNTITAFKLVTYDPSIPSKNKFVTSYADSIPVTVKPAPTDLDIEIPPAVPDSFYQQADSADVLAPAGTPSIEFTNWVWAAILAGVPIVCLGLFWPIRRRRNQRERNQASVRALTDLRAGAESPWSVVCRYLRERLDFAAQDAAPRETARFLKRRGFTLDRCAQAEAFLQACDLLRFTANSAVASNSLAAEAVRLIQALEADPCLRA